MTSKKAQTAQKSNRRQPPKVSDGREQRSKRTKARIQAAAEALFAKNDFASVTVESIVASAGVSKGTFYLHFDHKEDLLLAYAERRLRHAASILPDDFGRLLDLHHGREDLRDGVLRVLHDGSFMDDPTRVLRAVRFQARFGFSIESSTQTLLREAATSRALDTVSGERILNELTLMLAETDPRPALRRLLEWDLTAAVHPCWTPESTEVDRLLTGLGPRTDDTRLTPLLALLAPVEPACRESVMDRLKAGRRLRDAVRDLERYQSHTAGALASEGDLKRSELHVLLRGHAREVLELADADAAAGRASERIHLYRDELSEVQTLLTGADLLTLGFTEGLEVGGMLDELRRARLDGLVTSRDDELALARSRVDQLDGDKAGT